MGIQLASADGISRLDLEVVGEDGIRITIGLANVSEKNV